ncbi:Mov34/MPN/PAD-1 family protein [Leptolyngbya sp. PL-A3]|uniref:Mov34/MPN/PAD-1 family protein n=1 Tax=Leptolyngbya sp. PL-A3 TaxID=2933911 RepID=UPI00329833D0
MRLRLPPDQIEQLITALRRAGKKEIGGQIFGEQLMPSDFRAVELTLQKQPGTFARFIIDLVQAAQDALRFFERTEYRYTQFNYIGEWHSHPSFEVKPSSVDLATMRALVSDPEFQGNFAVLMIVRLDNGHLITRAWLFDPSGGEIPITLEIER